jgi:hypothetical protein
MPAVTRSQCNLCFEVDEVHSRNWRCDSYPCDGTTWVFVGTDQRLKKCMTCSQMHLNLDLYRNCSVCKRIAVLRPVDQQQGQSRFRVSVEGSAVCCACLAVQPTPAPHTHSKLSLY